MRKTISFLLLSLFLAGSLVSVPSSDAADSEAMDEYWCYGDSLALTFGSDSATITWKVTDPIGTILKVSEGPDLEYDVPKEYSLIYVTQTATTGYGSAEKRIAVHLMHFHDESVSVVFFDDFNGEPMYRQVFDGYTVCRNGMFLNLPEEPVPPSDNHVFGGWYAIIDGQEMPITQSFCPDRNTDKVVNVYAKWLEVYTCTFVNGGSFYCARSVVEGEQVELPDDPVDGDRRFIGWCVDEKCDVPFQEDYSADRDWILYANWAKDAKTDVLAPVVIAPIGCVIAVGICLVVFRSKGILGSHGRYRN